MKPFFYLLLFTSLFFACGKEGPGGKASIKGYVKHHTAPIPGAVVYIKYGTKESPGSNIQYYDASVTADKDAHYAFADFKAGNYYLFAVGFDSTINETVTGGVPVEVPTKTSDVTADIPVTE